MHFSLLQYLLLSLFFFLSLPQQPPNHGNFYAIVNLCFARSPRAKGSNFRTCAIAACPGFRDSPLMRMSMNRTLPDLPFACPGRSGYEIRDWVDLCDQPLTKSWRNSGLEIVWVQKRGPSDNGVGLETNYLQHGGRPGIEEFFEHEFVAFLKKNSQFRSINVKQYTTEMLQMCFYFHICSGVAITSSW